MKNMIRSLAVVGLSAVSPLAAATELEDLDFTRQISNGDFTAVPVMDGNNAFVWAQKVKASYEFRSTGAGNLFQTLTVVFKPAYSAEDRDRALDAAGLKDRGVAEPFTFFRKDEISCKFSEEVLSYFAENQQPVPRVTTIIGGYPGLCTLSVRVPTSWKDDLTEKLRQNRGLTFQARPLLCRQDSPKVAMKDLLSALDAKNVGQTLTSGEWQAPYLTLVYESVSLSLNSESIFGKKGGRKLWEKFFSQFNVEATQKVATLPADAVHSTLNVCYEHPLEVSYVGVENAAP